MDRSHGTPRSGSGRGPPPPPRSGGGRGPPPPRSGSGRGPPRSGSGREPPHRARTRPDQLRNTAGHAGGMP